MSNRTDGADATGGTGSGSTGEPVVVDARGLLCPLPVIRLAAAARSAPAGSVLTVLWTDPAARHDIPAWVRMRGHELLSTVVVDAPEPLTAEGRGTPVADQAYATTVRLG